MHCIGSDLCFWLYTIIDETLAALVSKYFHAKLDCSKSSYGAAADLLDIFLSILTGTHTTNMGAVGASYEKPNCYPENTYHFNFDNSPNCVIVRRDKCNGEDDSLASNIADTAQPLLFPFSIEFRYFIC